MGDDAYPAELERAVPLRDGGSIRLRPIRPDDAPRLQALHRRLSRDSVFFRFFSHLPELSDARAAHFATVDYRRRLAIVAVCPDAGGRDEQIVGVARYDLRDDGRAELGIVVEDRYQRHGIGSALLAALVGAARARGIRAIVAEVLVENRRMLGLLRESGLPTTVHRARDVLHVEIDLAPPA